LSKSSAPASPSGGIAYSHASLVPRIALSAWRRACSTLFIDVSTMKAACVPPAAAI